MNPIALPGCTPIPLACYLKALGVLRLVSEQADPEALGHWDRDQFILHTRLDRPSLLRFFLHEYCPTPILAPWNGGSGFYPSDNTVALRALENSQSPRLAAYRDAIGAARAVLLSLNLQQKPKPEEKEALLCACRNRLPEPALPWLDAAFVLTAEGAKYPPLLGSGGNDGRLEFTNNFMQRILDVMDVDTGAPTTRSGDWLAAALFSDRIALETPEAPVGQFYPGAAGGPNTTTGFARKPAINPWEYVLMLEGALLFAASAVRKLGAPGLAAAAFPFCVQQVAAGYGTASSIDELTPGPARAVGSRGEIWIPLWSRPTSVIELQAVFGEGRAHVGSRPACTGVDFARAIVTLGVDRGLDAFERLGFQIRNGRSFFATPLGRFAARPNAIVNLLSEIDGWLIRLRSVAAPKVEQVPASIRQALLRLENRILELCKEDNPARVQAVLIALGQMERALARSLAWTTGRDQKPPRPRIPPLSGLSPRWLFAADDGTAEFRLAAALASIRGWYKDDEGRPLLLTLRHHLEPVRARPGTASTTLTWQDPPSNDVVWHEGDLIQVLTAIFARRLTRAEQAVQSLLPDRALRFAPLPDIIAFLEGRTDDARLADLLWGLCLLEWQSDPGRTYAPTSPVSGRRFQDEMESPQESGQTPHPAAHQPSTAPEIPSAFFALLRLAFPRPDECHNLSEIPAVPMIHRLAAAGRARDASRLALRRLRGSGLHPALSQIAVGDTAARRAAAALLFPLSPRDFSRLRELVLEPEPETVL